MVGQLEDLLDRRDGHDERLVTALEREHVDDRDRERNAERERRAGAELGRKREHTAELGIDDTAHDVHAEAAATRLGRCVACSPMESSSAC